MNKYLLCFLIVCSGSVFSLPVGNPDSPVLLSRSLLISNESSINFRLGYEGSFVLNRRLKQEEGNHSRVDTSKIMTNSAVITLNVFELIDLLGILGSSELKFTWEDREAFRLNRMQLKTNAALVWSLGANMILYEWKKTSLGIGGRFLATDPSLKYLTVDGVSQSTQGGKVSYNEWQIDLGLSHKVRFFVPYIGVKYSNAHTRIRSNASGSFQKHFESRFPVGLFLGCSIIAAKSFFMNLEARVIDEEAFTISADLRF